MAVFNGTSGNNDLHGTSGNDTLNGFAGNDTLDGRTGADRMLGGTGDDLFYVDDSRDTVIELAGEGDDAVVSSISLTLADGIEALYLTGSAALAGTGNALDNVLVGNAAANLLSGLGGNDILVSLGGADTLVGGAGDDAYLVVPAALVIETADGGLDAIYSRNSWVLPEYVEDLILIGARSANGTGNALDNVIMGNRADNRLDGGGGRDTMQGGRGSDSYWVDRAGDRIIERAEGGDDRVQSTASYVLGSNVEDLTLLGRDALDATGNELNNWLRGNAGDNVLKGMGGADTLQGGAGNDTYYLDGTSFIDADRIMPERRGEGRDLIISNIGFYVPFHIERVELVGTKGLTVYGNMSGDHITGCDGNDVLMGGPVPGGENGKDTLLGAAGDDTIYAGGGDDLLIGGLGNDQLMGDFGRNRVFGGAGNDALSTNGPGGRLIGGEGDDMISLANTDSTTVVQGNLGNDLFVTLFGANSLLEGGQGIDTIKGQIDGLSFDSVEIWRPYGYSPFRATVAQLDSLDHVIVRQGKLALQLTSPGTIDLADTLGRGDISLSTSDQGNWVRLGGGNDSFRSHGLTDTLDGGGGDDMFVLTRLVSTVTLIGGAGRDRLYLTGEFDRSDLDDLTLQSVEVLALQRPAWARPEIFESFDVIENPGWHPVLVLTEGGAVNLAGELGAAASEITASAMGNAITSGSGDDTLRAGAGDDRLTGGAGADRFVFSPESGGQDRITDFTSGTDAMVLQSIVTGELTYLGKMVFTAPGHGEVRFVEGGLEFDLDGNGSADMTLALTGIDRAADLSAADFAVTFF